MGESIGTTFSLKANKFKAAHLRYNSIPFYLLKNYTNNLHKKKVEKTMKTRNRLILILSILFFCLDFIFATSVVFTNPSNAEVMTWVYTSKTTIPVNLTYSSSFSTQFGGYVRLTDHNGNKQYSNVGNGIDQWWYLTPGTYTWKLDIYDYNWLGQSFWRDSDQITFYVKHTIYVRNNFSGGTVKIDDVTKANGSSAYKYTSNTLGVEAIDQTISSVQYVWNTSGTNNSEWKRKELNEQTSSFISNARDYDYTVLSDDNGAEMKAYLRDKPAAPQNLSVTESTNEHPELSWDENTESDLDEYNVYREDTYYMGLWHNIGTTDSTSYEDTGVNTSHHHGDDIYYKVTAVDDDDIESDYSNSVVIEARIEKKSIDNNNEAAPKEYALNSNYPNPFNPTTQISYQIPNDGFVNLSVYNSLGQEVTGLVNQQQSIGRYTVQFNAASLSSGIYFYRIAAGEFNQVKKMLLVR